MVTQSGIYMKKKKEKKTLLDAKISEKVLKIGPGSFKHLRRHRLLTKQI